MGFSKSCNDLMYVYPFICIKTTKNNMTVVPAEFLTLDIIGHFGFDQQLDMLKSTRNRGILPTLHNFSWLMGVYEQMPFLTNLRLDKIGETLLAWTAARRKWKNWSSDFASTVFDRSRSSRTKSLFGAILKSKDHLGRPLCEAELWAEGSFLMLAGMFVYLHESKVTL